MKLISVKFKVYTGNQNLVFGPNHENRTNRNTTKDGNKRYERDGKQEMAQLLQGHQYKSLGCSCCSSIFLGIWGHIEAPEVNLLQTISREVS